MSKWTVLIYDFFEKIVNLAYVNILWFIFTLFGGVIFGIYPATIAMFTIIRRWTLHRESASIFKLFWKIYKQEFIRGNVLGLFISLIGGILLLDIIFFKSIHPLLYTMFLILFVIYFFTCCFVIPMFVHYNFKIRDYFKQSFILVIACPVSTILMILFLLFMLVCIYYLPGIIPFFSVSVTAYGAMKISLWTFNRIKIKPYRYNFTRIME